MMPTHAKSKPLQPGPLVTEIDPKSAAAEAYRTLRVNVQFAGLDEPVRTILVTSATSGEGKTTTVANFGVVLAQGGARVCLIDSDLRRPALHRLFGLPNTTGLTSALVDGKSLEDTAQATRVANLSVLTSGPPPPNPAELVGSKRMRDLIDSSIMTYDYVLLDSPPVISIADATSLSTFVDGVIFIVWGGKVPHEVVRRAAEHIERVKGRLLGVLLNSIDLSRDAYYYDYYRYYGAYEYGSNDKKQ